MLAPVRLLPANTYTADPALTSLLRAALRPETMAWAEPQLVELGGLAARELAALGDACERQPAWLRPIDPWGERVDEVVYPDEWRRRGAVAASFGLTGLPYEAGALRLAGPEVRVVHAALCYLFQPQTATYLCPVSMTDAAARVLADHGPPALRDRVLPHLVSRDPGQAWTAAATARAGACMGASTSAPTWAARSSWRWRGRRPAARARAGSASSWSRGCCRTGAATTTGSTG
jgi:hypothetical protein